LILNSQIALLLVAEWEFDCDCVALGMQLIVMMIQFADGAKLDDAAYLYNMCGKIQQSAEIAIS
jgi:hypothetical protein